MKILALSTLYKHHAKSGGYIQLAKLLKPDALLGVFETQAKTQPYLLRAYKWLFEWIAYFKYKNSFDLIHIYYGEEYFRFSSLLFSKTPVVVTFHQPPTRLKYEIEKGGTGGRIARFTHRLTKSRFRKLAAAIVLEEQQKEILAAVMPRDKIHVIYHGIWADDFTNNILPHSQKTKHQVITVGNWLRDWNLYKNILSICEKEHPSLRFILINRSLDKKLLAEFQLHKNFEYKNDLSDEGLFHEIAKSQVHLLPLIEATANNSLMESLALGCPIVASNVFSPNYQLNCEAINLFPKENARKAIGNILGIIALKPIEYEEKVKKGINKIKEFNWSNIAQKTEELYFQVWKI